MDVTGIMVVWSYGGCDWSCVDIVGVTGQVVVK